MTLMQMKYAIAVADTKSMNEAARSLFITQPSLSASIKELENEIGVELFKRTNRGITVTPEGEEFLGYARQVVEQLRALALYSGGGRYLFPGMRSRTAPISDMTLLGGLRRLGYGKDEMTVHGFRSMASTLLNEQGYNRDWIERQLAHGERNSVRAAYNYAEYLPERRRMMQEWADYLDSLRDGEGA